jgi:hypothetical protein
MDLSRYVDELQHQLLTAAAAGGEDTRAVAERLTTPLESAVRLVLLEALSEAAGEITAELAPGSVDVRLRGRDPELVVTPAPGPSAPVEAPTASAPGYPGVPETEEGGTTRTTLRLPDHLKTQVETAAARDGVSVNTWLVRAVAAALGATPASRPSSPGTTDSRGTRLTGWVR